MNSDTSPSSFLDRKASGQMLHCQLLSLAHHPPCSRTERTSRVLIPSSLRG